MISQTFSLSFEESCSHSRRSEGSAMHYCHLMARELQNINYAYLISVSPNCVNYYISYTLVNNYRVSFFTWRCQMSVFVFITDNLLLFKGIKSLVMSGNPMPNDLHSATEVVPFWGLFPWCAYVCVPNPFMLRHLPNHCLVTIKIIS